MMRFLFTKGAVQADGNWSRKPERGLEIERHDVFQAASLSAIWLENNFGFYRRDDLKTVQYETARSAANP